MARYASISMARRALPRRLLGRQRRLGLAPTLDGAEVDPARREAVRRVRGGIPPPWSANQKKRYAKRAALLRKAARAAASLDVPLALSWWARLRSRIARLEKKAGVAS